MSVNNSLRTEKEINIIKEIDILRKEKDALILAHFYQDPLIQDIADYVGDSLALAQWASKAENKLLVICGVHFMGETAKILSPDKKVLIPDKNAGCSLADSCPADKFEAFIAKHPYHTVISYVNTSAAVKALTDIVVTSSNAKEIVNSLPKNEKIIFGPDKNLGGYINSVTGRDMILWDGACHVHEEFSLEKIVALKNEHPDALLLAHPECEKDVLDAANYIGSTSSILNYATSSKNNKFIIATETGIMHELEKQNPNKTFIPAPPKTSETNCNECDYMKMNTLEKLYLCLKNEEPEIRVDENIRRKGVKSIERMLDISAQYGL